MKISHTDKIASAVLIVFSLTVFYVAESFPTGPPLVPGAGVFPQLIAVLIIGLAGVLIIEDVLTDEPSTATVEWSAVKPALSILGLFVVYLLLIPLAGFITSTTAYIIVMMKYSHIPLRRSAPIAVPISIVLFILFHELLSLPIPEIDFIADILGIL